MIAEAHQHTFQIPRQEEFKTPVCLSLLLAQGTLSYCLFSPGFVSPLEMAVLQYPSNSGDLAEQVDFFIHNHQLSRLSYEKILISILNPEFTIVPPAFGTTNADKVLDFTVGKKQSRHLIHHLKEVDVVAGANEALLSLLEKLFPGAHIRHGAATSLGLFASQHSLSTAELFMQINGQHLEVMARKDGRLLFYNLFSQQTDEDVLYYLMFVMEQFALNPATVKLSIAGDRLITDPLMKMIALYVRQINYCRHDLNLKLSGEFSTLPAHLYFNLLNQHLCE